MTTGLATSLVQLGDGAEKSAAAPPVRGGSRAARRPDRARVSVMTRRPAQVETLPALQTELAVAR